MSQIATCRYRLRFSKLGKVRFTSHRDVARMWERALRRARLPVASTLGFRPRPRLSFGLALSTGHESVAEYLDIDLIDDVGGGPVEATELPARLSPQLPAGIDVLAASALEPGETSLQEAVRSCSWRIEAADLEPAAAEHLVSKASDSKELVVTRRRKGRDVTDDLRPAILSVAVIGPTPGGTALEAELAVHPRSVRPAELLAALAPGVAEGTVCRTAQWIWRHGAREEPLAAAVELPRAGAPHAAACVIRRDHLDVRQPVRGARSHPAPEPSSRFSLAPAGRPPGAGN